MHVHYQNAWMLEMEKFPSTDDWLEGNLSTRLFGCIISLIKYVHEEELPQYFDRRVNLLADKDHDKLLEECAEIEMFYMDPGKYIK